MEQTLGVSPTLGMDIDTLTIRDKIISIEKAVGRLPGAMIGDCYPLVHKFVPGMYIREITMPPGHLVVSKIHKIEHPYFVLKGDVSVLTEDGVVRIKAPYSGITKAGTKRVLYIHEETVWTTIHKTDEIEIEKIEEEIIAKSFNDLELDIIEITNFIEEVVL